MTQSAKGIRPGRPLECLRVVALLTACAASGASADAVAALDGPSRVGHRYPSERSVYTDEKTGREVIRLTASPASDIKIYQTHASWTADQQWIVFSSDRTGSKQLFAVHEERGDIVQLTDEPGVNAGQVNVSHRRAALVTVIGREVIELNLGPILEPKGSPASRAAAPRVVGRLPDGARLSGTTSWDELGNT